MSKMKTWYCDVWIRGMKNMFSWHTQSTISLGSRVLILFRGQKKIGVVVHISEQKPAFETQPILEVLNDPFIPTKYMQIVDAIATETLTRKEKIMSLMVPEKFTLKQDPSQKEVWFILKNDIQDIKGIKQKEAIDLIKSFDGRISEPILRKSIPLSTVKALLGKGIFERYEGDLKNTTIKTPQKRSNFPLTPAQKQAFDQIKQSKIPCLLFGVTGSGKTEIYKKLAEGLIEKDATAQILFLLPEIALTAQLIAEFYAVFGNLLAVWHSKLSENEKIQEWERCRLGTARVLIGTRSAVFVPLQNPKLIILDEEHEWTFKNEFAPRYWTHDIVKFIADQYEALLVFGTATPRIESYEKCKRGEWTRIDLPHRINEVKMPSIQMIDLKNEMKKGNDSPLSDHLKQEIYQLLERKKQGVLFLNKRGYSGSTMCKACGHTFECPHCSYKMKMHEKDSRRLFLCHVCGHLESFPKVCPECKTPDFVFRGWGTQMVEKALYEAFPGIRVLRADADSITGKYDFDALIQKFHNGEADILLGTQMIAKGLDFERVHLVGVILADVGLSLPDFRSEERVYQLLTQVSGRAGRRNEQGHIVIQTFHPTEKIFEFVRHSDTEGFLQWQNEIREKMKMPPYSILGKVTFSDVDKTKAYQEAHRFYIWGKENKEAMELEDIYFAPAFFPKSYGRYHFHVLLKSYKREAILLALQKAKQSSIAAIDIDPVSIL